MKKIKVVLGFVFVVFLVVSFSCAPSPSETTDTSSETINLKFASYYPEAGVTSEAHKRWCEEITRRTDGRVQWEYFWGASLLATTDTLKGTSTGIADASMFSMGYSSAEVRLVTGWELPYTATDPWVAAMAAREMYLTYPPAMEEFTKNNVLMMDWMAANVTIICFRDAPVNTLEDLRKLKIRCYGGVVKALDLLGVTAVGIPAGDTYEAVQKGVVDGISGIVFDSLPPFRFHEVAPHIADPGFGNYACSGVTMNKDTYDKLPPDIREIVDEVTEEAYQFHLDMLNAEHKRLYDELSASPGINLYKIPDAEKERWRDIVTPEVWDIWVQDTTDKGYADAQEFLDTYLSLLDKYSSQKSPWKGWTSYLP